MKIKNGDWVKDTLTDFEGKVIGIAEYAAGCSRIYVQPNAVKDGQPVPADWWDEKRFVAIKKSKTKKATKKTGNGGPPRNEPKR